MKMTRVVLGMALALGVAASAAAQSTVFLVRHAEKADVKGASGMMAEDPDLSDAGRARAQSLASMLKDANITTILVTQYKRTRQTAAPLAEALGVKAVEVHSDDIDGIVKRISAASGNVLVVSHSGSVPKALTALGMSKVPSIPETEYDNLFVVTRGATPSMVRLRFR